MGKYEELAPTIAAAGVPEEEVVAKEEAAKAAAEPPKEPLISAEVMRVVLDFAAAYGKTYAEVSEGRRKYLGKSVEEFALGLGLWPSQVRQVMHEFKEVVASAKAAVPKDVPKDGEVVVPKEV